MILMIDNYDSFTYNLVQYLGELGEDLKVFRNDKIKIEDIKKLKPKSIVISPGPGTPLDAGISLDVIKEFKGVIPILGVCLGHQCIGQAFAGKVVLADKPMHGKVSLVYHDGKGIFYSVSSPFEATRYHSLVVEKKTLPCCLRITAWTKEGHIMGLAHKDYPIWGVQFHPESIMTKSGKKILANFLKQK